MEDSTTHGENNSRSASEKGVSDTEQKKRGSGGSNSSKPNQIQEDSTTPKTMPPHGSQQFTMGPPPKPNFKATPTSAQPSNSMSQVSSQSATQELPAASSQTIGNGDDQPAAPSKHPINNTTQATSRKRSHVEVDQEPTAHGQESLDEDAEPADKIAPFDWMELESRYHHQMDQYAIQEQELYSSFHQLCQVTYVLLASIVALLIDTVLLCLGRDWTRPRGGPKLQTVSPVIQPSILAKILTSH
jgi:hypothetical protein